MKIKRKLYSDIPMIFEVKEIGVDSDGKFAIITAKNDITGEIIEKKMYEKKSMIPREILVIPPKKLVLVLLQPDLELEWAI